MPTTRFPFRLGRRSRPLLRVFGVRGIQDAYVDLDEAAITARFGRFEISTPVDNLSTWRIEGPWRWITAIGVRRSVRHGDLTFGGSHRGGVRLDFHRPVSFRPLRPPALYVTVEDVDGLTAALTALGIPGADARDARGWASHGDGASDPSAGPGAGAPS